MTGDRKRGVAIEVLLHEREREVHSGRHAGRCPDRAVANEDGVGVHVHIGVHAGKLGGRRPVGGGPLAVEQPGAREQESAGAHGHRASGRGGCAGDPGDESAVVHRLPESGSASNDQRVDARRRRSQGCMRHQREAA